MKIRSVILVVIFSIFSVSSLFSSSSMDYVSSQSLSNDKGEGGNDPGKVGVTSQLKLAFSNTTSLTGISPINLLCIEGSSIEAFISPNTGIVNVEISDSYGNVFYTKLVNASVESYLYIDISNLEASTYTISFADEGGLTLSKSNFTIK